APLPARACVCGGAAGEPVRDRAARAHAARVERPPRRGADRRAGTARDLGARLDAGRGRGRSVMSDEALAGFAALRRAAIEAPGTLDRGTRQAALAGQPVRPELAASVDHVRRHAYRVTDGDVDTLRRAGYSEDQVLELTIAT